MVALKGVLSGVRSSDIDLPGLDGLQNLEMSLPRSLPSGLDALSGKAQTEVYCRCFMMESAPDPPGVWSFVEVCRAAMSPMWDDASTLPRSTSDLTSHASIPRAEVHLLV